MLILFRLLGVVTLIFAGQSIGPSVSYSWVVPAYVSMRVTSKYLTLTTIWLLLRCYLTHPLEDVQRGTKIPKSQKNFFRVIPNEALVKSE